MGREQILGENIFYSAAAVLLQARARFQKAEAEYKAAHRIHKDLSLDNNSPETSRSVALVRLQATHTNYFAAREAFRAAERGIQNAENQDPNTAAIAFKA